MKIHEYNEMMRYLTRPSKKNYDDSPVYNTTKYLNPETRIQELATGGRIGFAKAGFVFGDQTFNIDIPNMTPLQSKSFQKGLKDLEKWLKNPNAENWIETFRTPSKKGQTHQSDFSLNLRNYIQGQPVKARAKELFDSVNIKNLLGDKVKDIQTYTPQEFRRVTNLPKSKKAADVALNKSMKAANAVRDVFVADPDADLEDVARGIFGKDFDKASVVVQEDMLNKASDDTAKLLEALTANRKVKGFKPIAANKMGDIIKNLEDNTKDFKFREGTIREYKFRVRDSLLGLKTESEQGFRNLRNIVGATDKTKVIDEVFGLSATFKNAPGYVENVQLIDKKINNIKGKQIDKPFSAIVNAVKNKKEMMQYEGKEIKVSEAIKKFNAKSKAFSNANNISTPQIFVGDNLDATKLVSNFNKYSSEAQKNILRNAEEGFVLNATRPSTPAGTFKPTKTVTTSSNYQKAKSIFGKTAGKVGTKLTQLDAPIVAAPFTVYSTAKLASDIARGEETDVGATDITLPLAFTDMSSKALGLYNPAKTSVGSQVLRAGLSPQLASKILPKIAKGSVYATPVIETLIQAYNAKKRLEEAKRKSSVFEERAPTLLGDAPKSYLDEIMSELPEVDRMGAASGGIASLTRTTPPERGPQYRGLDYLRKHGRKY